MAYALAKHLALQCSGDRDEQRLVFLTLNVLGLALSQGDVCVDVKFYANTRALIDFDIEDTFPEANVWLQWLSQQEFVSHIVEQNSSEQNSDKQNFVTLDSDRLYLTKYFDWENRFAF